MPAKGVCLRAENLSLALLFLIGRHFSTNQKLFLFSRFYKRSQLYILYSDDSLDKCETKSFGKYETSASRNPFLLHLDISEISDDLQDELLDMRNDLSVRELFLEKSLSQFWISMQLSYPKISRAAFKIVVPFASTYLCERWIFDACPSKNDSA